MMTAEGIALFDTAIGACAIAWRGEAIAGSHLPERDVALLRDRMRRRFPGAPETTPPPHVAAIVDRVRTLVETGTGDLADVALDVSGVSEFDRAVYAIARAIPPGETLTYGEIAVRLGDKTLARAVGQALGSNPFPPIVPCHRIVAANGTMHGFSATGGLPLKLRLLRAEGWRANEPTLFD